MLRVNPVFIILALSIILNILFGYLSYNFYSEKGAVQTALISCQESNSSLVKQVEKQKKEVEIQSRVVSEFQQKQQEIHKQQCKIIEQITLLPKSTTQGKQNDEIDIDSKLPVALIGLLRESHYSLQGTPGSNASESFD